MAEGPYCKVYFVDLERDYPDVWASPLDLGTYVRMLALANVTWPSRPEFPKSAKAQSVRRLVDSGLIVPVLPYHFTVRGLDAERTARRNAARIANGVRWGVPSRVEVDIEVERTSRAKGPRPKKNGVVLDERELSDDEQRARYVERMLKRTGVEP